MSKLKDFSKKKSFCEKIKAILSQAEKLISMATSVLESPKEQFLVSCSQEKLQDTIANWNKGGFVARQIVPSSDGQYIVLFDRGI